MRPDETICSKHDSIIDLLQDAIYTIKKAKEDGQRMEDGLVSKKHRIEELENEIQKFEKENLYYKNEIEYYEKTVEELEEKIQKLS